jgi:hypothetical protein
MTIHSERSVGAYYEIRADVPGKTREIEKSVILRVAEKAVGRVDFIMPRLVGIPNSDNEWLSFR